jgi:paraquat-inducible protein A
MIAARTAAGSSAPPTLSAFYKQPLPPGRSCAHRTGDRPVPGDRIPILVKQLLSCREFESGKAGIPVTLEHGQDELPGYAADGLVACRACDCVHRIVTVPPRGKALCRRCGAILYRNMPRSLDHAAALYLAAMILFLLANTFPFVALQYGDRIEHSRLISGGLALFQAGMGEIGFLVLLTSVVFPFLTLLGMLYLLLPLRCGIRPRWKTRVWLLVRALNPWSLIGVFMLGLLVSVVKLQDLAVIIPGVAFYAFIGLLVVSAAAVASFDPAVLWRLTGPAMGSSGTDAANTAADTAAAMGYATCHTCDLLVRRPAAGEHWTCPRCGSAVHGMRHTDSITRTWALLGAATLLLVPANLLPVMTVIRFGQGEPSTILAGVVHLIQDGAWPLGLLVLFASFVVPLSKIASLLFLLVTVQRGSNWRRRDRTLIYRVTEVVGAWSMVDIFLVGILVALVRMDGLATVYPGSGATFFGAAVVLTMLAAHTFDPRLIWDREEHGRHEGTAADGRPGVLT